MDYTSGPYTVTFPAGQTNATFNIPINDDYNRFEGGIEDFHINIISSLLPNGVVVGHPIIATVIIMDDDSKL